MTTKIDVAIIGAGTAGLSAFKEVSKVTDKVLVINGGSSGTTCARVGCMPSKVLIQVANDFQRRKLFEQEGIRGADSLRVDGSVVLAHVRALRDRFVNGVLKTSVKSISDRYIEGYARFLEPTVLQVGEQRYEAKASIIATGSRPVVPPPFKALGDSLITSDEIFELQKLPESLAVIGLGAIGLELGQAISHLGLRVFGFDMLNTIGGLTDPAVIDYALQVMGEAFPLYLGEAADIEKADTGLLVKNSQQKVAVQTVLASLGRRPNIDGLGLENLGVELDKKGIPAFDKETLQVNDQPIFIAGDVNAERPLLHEAADDGRIAGYNAVRSESQCFKRRTPLRIAFTEPNLAVVGQSYSTLKQSETAIGETRFDTQGRALIMGQNSGIIRVYGEKSTGRVLGAEMMAPAGEHLAHLLAWSIQQQMTAFDILRMPFYHPVVEEGLRTAIRDLAGKVEMPESALEMATCDAEAPSALV